MPHRLDTPVRGERIRCALARHIYLHHLWFHRLSHLLAPDTHPWKHLSKSSLEQTRELTYTALRPRNVAGEVVPMTEGEPRMHPAARAAYAVLATYLVYFVMARVVEGIPPILPIWTEQDALLMRDPGA